MWATQGRSQYIWERSAEMQGTEGQESSDCQTEALGSAFCAFGSLTTPVYTAVSLKIKAEGTTETSACTDHTLQCHIAEGSPDCSVGPSLRCMADSTEIIV